MVISLGRSFPAHSSDLSKSYSTEPRSRQRHWVKNQATQGDRFQSETSEKGTQGLSNRRGFMAALGLTALTTALNAQAKPLRDFKPETQTLPNTFVLNSQEHPESLNAALANLSLLLPKGAAPQALKSLLLSSNAWVEKANVLKTQGLNPSLVIYRGEPDTEDVEVLSVLPPLGKIRDDQDAGTIGLGSLTLALMASPAVPLSLVSAATALAQGTDTQNKRTAIKQAFRRMPMSVEEKQQLKQGAENAKALYAIQYGRNYKKDDHLEAYVVDIFDVLQDAGKTLQTQGQARMGLLYGKGDKVGTRIQDLSDVFPVHR